MERRRSGDFSFLQQVLQKQDSPFYALLERMVHEVAHKSLQHFSVALGWDSWTEGGKLLRQSAEKQNWIQSLMITEATNFSCLVGTDAAEYCKRGAHILYAGEQSGGACCCAAAGFRADGDAAPCAPFFD